jgi:hypothetical protein
MPKNSALDQFLNLVASVNSKATARSEADLSTRLANALESLDLHTVVDTGQAGGKRPDILCYTTALDADLVMPAEVVIEGKRPSEVVGTSLQDAVIGKFWADKTVPYVSANLARIQYFILTTYSEFAVLRIDAELRRAFSRPQKIVEKDRELQAQVKKATQTLTLAGVGGLFGREQATSWKEWVSDHLHASRLRPPKLSEARNTVPVRTAEDLEVFAGRLADLAAGRSRGKRSQSGIFAAVCKALPESESQLDSETRRDLNIFAMAATPFSTLGVVNQKIKHDYLYWRDEFVAASIHSLISRLFTLKVVEDVYCVGHKERLVEPSLWVINSDEYDDLEAEALRLRVKEKIQALKESRNGVIEQLAVFGAFYDWIWKLLDPVLFRTLFELLVTFDFSQLEHDLLGRFFEIYSQAVNRSQRKALGQYYTPVPIVRYMWAVIASALPKDGTAVTVLDPGMGSGTFLKEGAPWLARRSERFWERMVGFDISAQVMGIAEANVYTAVLQQLDSSDALKVKNLRLYTTDSLDPRNGKYLTQIAPLFDDAAHRSFLERNIEVSATIKRKEHFRVVIGNPPYKNNSDITLAEVARRFPALLQSSAEAAAAQARNIRDDYAWFFAAADHYVQDAGLICLITSDSYTRKPSYRYFREQLLRSYRVERLVRLGASVFKDVSPRISFAIILLRKRSQRLGPNPATGEIEFESIPFYDVAALAQAASGDVLATDEDPRLKYLAGAAKSLKKEIPPVMHRPSADRDFSLLPVEDAFVDEVVRDGVPVSAKGPNRIFRKKWPGIITAFDSLLRANDKSELGARVEALYAIAQANAGDASRLAEKITEWSGGVGLAEEVPRLISIATQIAARGLAFKPENIKRSFAGSIPNEVRWYPSPKYRCAIYYEPELHIERNVHEGKSKGWGTMEQWREPASHTISPKLIFTTSSNPHYGYKAFVVDDEWYVKLHGGTSQQYNYTGLYDPSGSDSLGGAPNNIAGPGEELLKAVVAACGRQDSLLHYIAAIYNSELAIRFLGEESGHDLHVRVPSKKDRKAVARVVELAQELRDLHRVQYDMPRGAECPAATLESLATHELLTSLGLRRVEKAAHGFKSRVVYEIPGSVEGDVSERIGEAQKALDRAVNRIYGL